MRAPPPPWMTPPALMLAAGLALGIGVASVCPAVSAGAWMAAAGGCGLAAVGGYLWRRSRLVSLAPLATVVALGGAVVAGGGSWYRINQQLPKDHFAHHLPLDSASEIPLVVRGRVADVPDRDDRGVRFSLSAERIIRGVDTLQVTGLIRASFWSSPWEAASYPAVFQDDEVELRGTLEPPPPRRNPADFDYGAYLRRRGVHGTLSGYDAGDLRVIERAQRVRIRAVGATRAHIRSQIDRWISAERARHVLRALLLGDRSAIDPATREQFARTGLMHLLAVSGLHVLLVGMVLYGLLRPALARLRLRWRTIEITRAAFTMGVLLFYLLITGSRPSVVRAVVMAGLFIGGAVLQRPTYSLNTLGAAAILLLIARPSALFDAGFQLSFAAVGAIVLLVPRLRAVIPERWLRRKLIERPLMLVVVSLAATLGTMPVLMHHFGYASLAGLALNVLAIPLTALSMAAGLATVAFGGWAAPLGMPFGAAASVLTSGLLATAEFGHSAFGWAVVSTPSSAWPLLLLIVGVGVISQWSIPRRRWRLIVLGFLIATMGTWQSVVWSSPPRLEVLFFSVGQGDAALVSFPNGRHLLVDAGPRTPFSDAARRTVLPHLQRYGISRLDAVVVTHADSDHLGGLPTLLRSVPVGRVLHNGRRKDSNLYREVMHLLDSLGVSHRAVQAGDTLGLDSTVSVRVLAPIRSVRNASDNEASVVLHVAYGSVQFVLTGDIGGMSERALVKRYGGLEAEVATIPHHGSRTSSTPLFVREVVRDSTVFPSRAIVSVGESNRFGLPDPEVIRRWTLEGAVVQSTADGAVWLHTNGVCVREVDWR